MFSNFQNKYLGTSKIILRTSICILTYLWFSFLNEEAMSLSNGVMSEFLVAPLACALLLSLQTKCDYVQSPWEVPVQQGELCALGAGD